MDRPEEKKRIIPGAEARLVAGMDVRAEARTYLRGKDNSQDDEVKYLNRF